MAIAKITGQGLTSIAVLVALLWTCVIGQRILTARANQATAEVLHAMRMLQIQQHPAATPQRPLGHRPHAKLG